jgi:hypothetical protein
LPAQNSSQKLFLAILFRFHYRYLTLKQLRKRSLLYLSTIRQYYDLSFSSVVGLVEGLKQIEIELGLLGYLLVRHRLAK